jgi:hypothetical protein
MPTENDPKAAAPAPKKVVITNDPSNLNLGTSGQVDEFTGERLELPSRGLLYAQNNPASQGWIMVRPITTKEEEILITERFHKQGVAIDMILSRCIMTKGINTLDLLSGDRLHILFYLRAISYGPEYTFRTRMRDGSEQEIKTDVSKLTIETLPDGFTEPWIVQLDGTTYELRLSRGKDEQEAIVERLRNKKRSPNAPDSSPTDALKRQIVSVNGVQDRDEVAKHVGRMVAKQAHHLRAELGKISPGPKLKIDVMNQETGESEEVVVAITESFFRP